MPSIDSIIQQLNDNHDIKQIRGAIAELIECHLVGLKDSLGYWEKAHLAHAIAALGQNIHLRHQPTSAWLQLCLIDIEKALIPANQRNESYAVQDGMLDALTYEQLIDAISALRREGC